MIMEKIDVEAFKKEWFSFEEIDSITKSINNFNTNWKTHSHDEVRVKARNEIFSNKQVNV